MQSRYFTTVMALTKAYIRRVFRDKVALFFTFLFPLMFLLVFGGINSGNRSIAFDVALINHSNTDYSKQFAEEIKKNNSIKIKEEVTQFEEARQKMGRGEIDSILEIPAEFGMPNSQGVPSGNLVVYYEAANPQSGQTLAAFMQGVFDKINKDLTQVNMPFTVEPRSTSTSNLSSFDYVFAGLLGFTMLSLGIFGMANGFPSEKKTGAFRRLRVAPMKPSQLIFANAITYLATGLLSIVLMYITAVTVFGFQMRGNYFSLILFSIFGILMMFGFGLAIGGWAKNENQSAPLSNLVAFPMMFLSGVFFPRFLMPEWLQKITTYLPLSPIVDGLRNITAEGKNILEIGPQLLIMTVWTVLVYIIAIKVFRWE